MIVRLSIAEEFLVDGPIELKSDSISKPSVLDFLKWISVVLFGAYTEEGVFFLLKL